jgi:signal transduction histidine kinase
MNRRLPPELVRRLVLVAGLTLVVLTSYGVIRAVCAIAGVRHLGTPVWLAATALVAVAVPPARRRLDRIADRLAYGVGGDPYAVMTRFVQRIADTLAVDEVLPDLARTASQAMHGSGSEVRLWLADGGEWRQTWPSGRDQVGGEVVVALQHGGDPVGRLQVELVDDDLSAADRALLDRLAGPAGLALSNVRLAYELRRRLSQESELADQLRRSRLRLVEARAAQRRRFAKAVDARVQTHLTAADEALAAAVAAVPDGRAALLDSAAARALAALEALRDLAVGVFPPILQDGGLYEALDQYVAAAPGRPTLRSAGLDEVRPHPAIEATVYFCCVGLVDDMAGPLPLTVSLDRHGATLRLAVRGPLAPTADTEKLLRDRVDAIGGTVSTASEPPFRLVTVALPMDVSDDVMPNASPAAVSRVPAARAGGQP